MNLLLDFSQILTSEAVDYFHKTREKIDIALLRHMITNSILSYRAKFKCDPIICCDGKDYWRKTIFPYYKMNRKKMRETSKFDWAAFYDQFNQLKIEIKAGLPFKLIEAKGCEADDVIAILTKKLCSDGVVIVSGDKDFVQLASTTCQCVKQWSPIHKKFISSENTDYNLMTHIIKGDPGDGIPNILSDRDTFINDNKRCSSVTKQFLARCLQGDIDDPTTFLNKDHLIENFYQNRALIDLRRIPSELVETVNNIYDCYDTPKVKITDFLIKNKLVKIMQKGDFQ